MARYRAVHVQLEVSELGALRLARRAAGIDKHRGVVGVARPDITARLAERGSADEVADRAGPLRQALLAEANQVQRDAKLLAGLGRLLVDTVESDQDRR